MRIRPLVEADLDAVVDIHMFAFRDYMSSLLGKRYNRAMIAWFIKKECVHLVSVDDDDKVTGYYFAAPWGYQKQMNRDLLKIATIEMIKRPWIFFNSKILYAVKTRTKTMLGKNKFIDTTRERYPGKLMSMVGMGIRKDALRQGIAVALMAAAHDECRKMGYQYARGTIYKTNVKSRTIHEKMGYKAEEETSDFTIGYYLKF